MVSKFYEEIKNALIEREVEDVYNKGINLYFPGVAITHPFGCDGLVDTKTSNNKILKLIIEYKLNELLSSKSGRAKILIQVIFYLKQFEINGMLLPNVCMVGDKNECFVIHTNSLLKYLDEENINWGIAASSAYMKYPDFVVKIANDDDINPFVFNVDENFSFNAVAQKICDLADNVQRYVHVTEHNIATIYDYFCRNVVKNIKKIKSHDLVSIFMGVITNGDDYYQHPSKKNLLVTPMGNIDINGDGFKSFFGYFQRTYTPQEKNNLTAIADRLIEDTDRRNSGDFWTPTLFVDYAHKMITEHLGEYWKDEYVVWDNCCGSKNLTRDYKFKELYCSTLFDSELNIGERYNKEATSLQFDFLNDYIPMPGELVQGDTKIPEGLLNALKENKKIVFFLNPPYATTCNFGNKNKNEDGNDTVINAEMKNNGMKRCSDNLYGQFLYNIIKIKRAYKLTKCHICIFCPTLFLTGESYVEFRKEFFKDFTFNTAIQFKASEFADVSDSWGISFSIWDCGINKNNQTFLYSIVENNDGEVKNITTKNLYNIDDNETLTHWTKSLIKKEKTYDAPQMTSGIKWHIDKNGCRGNIANNAIGFLYTNSNNVDKNGVNVGLFTSCFSSGSGCSILPINFTRCASLFSARKLIEKNWINSKDEYLAPNEQHPLFNEYVNDSVIYSLFHSASNQSSLRQVEYKDKLWDIKNEFCWYDINMVKKLSNENNLDFTYNDASTMDQRFVYKYIQEHINEISKEAMDVLTMANEMVYKSFKYRELFNEDHKEYQILNADIGYYQLKALYKEYMKEELEEFKKLYKVLSDKMRPMVYELGFLKK